MIELDESGNAMQGRTHHWLILAIVVMVVTIVPMIFFGPFGLLAYVCGFLSTALSGYLVFTGFVPFVFVAVFVWAVLVVDRHLKRGGRGWHFVIFWIALIAIPVGPLHFRSVPSSPWCAAHSRTVSRMGCE